MPELVDIAVPEEWVTKGQKRPAIVLRQNEDGTSDVLMFHHPEDRQTAATEVQLRVPADRLPQEPAPPAPPTPNEGSGVLDASSPNQPKPPPAPARGLQAGRPEAANEVP